jgi:hypothetical protein
MYVFQVVCILQPFILFSATAVVDTAGMRNGLATASTKDVHPQLDAIIVLGGGLTAEGFPPPWQRARCALAAELYFKTASKQSKRPVIVTLSGGTPWKPQPRGLLVRQQSLILFLLKSANRPLVDGDGFAITEAAASARLLHSHGIPYTDLFEVITFYSGKVTVNHFSP